LKTSTGHRIWDFSITKFVAFNQTQYLRLIHLDSDVTLLNHMDDLFLLPPTSVAMTRAYWDPADRPGLASAILVIEPSTDEAERLIDAARAETREDESYDKEILNDVYGNSAMVLPHRRYGLSTREFRNTDHSSFLGNLYEKWDPDRALREASLVRFSDWPIPKPWIMWPRELLVEMMPKCELNPGTEGESGCRDREIWMDLYNDFRKRRRDVCRLLSVPAPEWPPTQ
jgi:alpha-N-acetylglucosamine transferase